MRCKYCRGKVSILDFLLFEWEKICNYCKEARERIEEEKVRDIKCVKENLFELEVKKRRKYFI